MSAATLVEYIKCSSAAIEKGAALHRRQAAYEKLAADSTPQLVETFLQAGIILPTEREKAANMLRDPASLLKFCGNMAATLVKHAKEASMRAEQPQSMGQPVQKVASAGLNAYDKFGATILGGGSL
jgi:hypothetical protein